MSPVLEQWLLLQAERGGFTALLALSLQILRDSEAKEVEFPKQVRREREKRLDKSSQRKEVISRGIATWGKIGSRFFGCVL